MLQAVTLDFWNTLFIDQGGREREHVRAARLRDELALVNMRPRDEEIHHALRAGYRYFDEVWRSESRTPDTGEIVDTVLLELRARLPAESRARIIDRYATLLFDFAPVPVPGLAETLRQMAKRWRLAVICDTGYSPGWVLRRVLEQQQVLALFEYLYFSDEGGMSKPDPRVFRFVLDQLGGIPAGEAAHVGDLQRTDIAGAQGAGMLTVHFVGANDQDAAESTADVLVTRFDELPRALGNLMCAGC